MKWWNQMKWNSPFPIIDPYRCRDTTPSDHKQSHHNWFTQHIIFYLYVLTPFQKTQMKSFQLESCKLLTATINKQTHILNQALNVTKECMTFNRSIRYDCMCTGRPNRPNVLRSSDLSVTSGLGLFLVTVVDSIINSYVEAELAELMLNDVL